MKLSADRPSAELLDQFDQLKWSGANWDKVLIDEGQDWPDDEREILFRLFKPKNFIVACGTGQLVRSTIPANWTKDVDFHKPIVYERRSLRQKRNLCEFQRLYAEAFGLTWDLEPSDELTGGEIIIVLGSYTKELHEKLDQKCRADGNGAYEHLFVVPPSLTVNEGGLKRFALTTGSTAGV
jgi:hypothetical protein